jgi:hypothetical protein
MEYSTLLVLDIGLAVCRYKAFHACGDCNLNEIHVQVSPMAAMPDATASISIKVVVREEVGDWSTYRTST